MKPGPTDSLTQKNSWAVLAVILLGWIAIGGWSVHRYQPASAKPASVPSNVFSADRAWKYLERLVGNNLPHPAGSKENERVAGVIEQHFSGLGFDVEVQTGIREIHPGAKDRLPGIDEVPIKNLIVTVPGERSSEEVLLLAVHHDSVPFGPGASDDGLSVAAAMEIGNMLAQFPPQHNVTILFSDGEELGLLGAKLFAEEHPMLKRVGVVLNFDARGTAGPTLMFETQGNTNQLIPALAAASDKPFASSLFYEVYKRLPRDTDFSVFKNAKLPGLNFALIGDVDNYHTPADNLANANPDCLQHQGETMWATMTTLDAMDSWDQLAGDDTVANRAVYFDWCGYRLFWWPESFGRIAAIAWLLLWLCCGLTAKAVRWETIKSTAWSLLAVVSSTLAGLVFFWLIRQHPDLAHPWPAQAEWVLLATGAVSIATAAAIGLVPAAADRSHMLFGVLGGWCLMNLMVAWTGAGASYLFQLPAAIGVASCLLETVVFRVRNLVSATFDNLAPNHYPFTIVLFAIAAGAIWLPLEPLFYDAVGFRMPAVIGVRFAMLQWALLPAIFLTADKTRTGLAFLAVALAVACCLVAILV